MRNAAHAPEGHRHGEYPKWNYVRNPQDGTFRMVHQAHDIPDTGAMNYTYSTFMVPVQDLYGAGMPLTRGVPAALPMGPAPNIWNMPNVLLPAPMGPVQGAISPMPLLPSDLVNQFSGKSL